MKRQATSSFPYQPGSVDDALLAPWIATGVVDPQDSRLFAAAMVSDPALADDLAAAHAEQAEVVAMGEALGRPSMRPLLELFAALESESGLSAANITRLTFDRALDSHSREGLTTMASRQKRISRHR